MAEKDGMVKESNSIKVYMRVRPTTKAFVGFKPKLEDDSVEFELDKDQQGYVNNTKLNYRFKFDGIFDMDATQEEVFKSIACPVIDDAMKGVNGTIFAYGQTGSGKTYTITGGSERYVDRGLIPRTISELFERIRADGKSRYEVFISYLEIYNNAGYDLLSRDDAAQRLEDLPKVILREDEDGNMHLKNLSVNVANSEEDALNLLFLGDTNRVVAETPMNDASTRSHCLFILWLRASIHGTDTVRQSKIHLVDLAGSERTSKTGIEGGILKEAKYINVSLHHLELVIVALQERTQGHRSHVPYRNSVMTSVLRDSLGGNCKTVMIGNVAVESANIDETISTCRFAQRVACIKNTAIVNEEMDPNLVIKRLKREIAELKDQIKELGGAEEEDLTVEDIDRCKKTVQEFIEDTSAPTIICGGRKKTQACFGYFRDLVLQGGGGFDASGNGGSEGGTWKSTQKSSPNHEEQIKQLQLEIAQRDQEIGILVQIVNKHKGGGGEQYASSSATCKQKSHDTSTMSTNIDGGDSRMTSQSFDTSTSQSVAGMPAGARVSGSVAGGNETIPGGSPQKTRNRTSNLVANVPKGREAAELLLDRTRAFEHFRKSVRRNESFEENKELLRNLYSEAKAIGEKANAARQGASEMKTKIQQLRLSKAMGQEDDGENAEETCEEEKQLIAQLEQEKAVYTETTTRLRKVKHDIERIQQVLEQNKKRLQKDFETWFVSLRKEATGALQEIASEVKECQQQNRQHVPPKLIGDKQIDAEISGFYNALNRIN